MLKSREKHISEINSRLSQLEKEKQQLLDELKSLKVVDASKIIYGMPASESIPTTPESRIALFSKLFRCRKDVYPRLWENAAKGTSGYSPVCKNEWIRGVCHKPKVKCTNCLNRDFVALDESAIRNHLMGKMTIGTYTIRDDDTCIFLVADFDKEQWQQDVLAYKNAASELGIAVSVERSRSGNGAHAWIFFKEPIQARIARQLGMIILTRAISKRYSISLESYDRFFPNQDTIPKGSFGNLIALPLQRLPRKRGNSVFIDDDLVPYADQWSYLARVQLFSIDEVSGIIEKHSVRIKSRDDIPDHEIELATAYLHDPVSRIENIFSGKVCVEFAQNLEINISHLPSKLIVALKRLATFANPKFYEAQRLRFSTWNIPRYICCAELIGDRMILPRGLCDKCLDLLRVAGAEVKILDKRNSYKNTSVSFIGQLLPDQIKAFNTLSNSNSGVFVAPPGSGKTVIACSLIAERKLPTLVLVHRKQLVEQWKKQIVKFLDLDEKSIGSLVADEKKRKGIIDIGMLQTISKMKDQNGVLDKYGLIIIDECHHVPAISFESVLKRISARYFMGLTATPFRKDGLQAIIHMQCGPTLCTMAETTAQSDLIKKVIVRETPFQMPLDTPPQPAIHEIWDRLVKDPDRLELVVNDVVKIIKQKRFPLILSDRKEHLELLFSEISKHMVGIDTKGFILTSEIGKRKRTKILTEMKTILLADQCPFLLSTGSLIGEGFDLPALSALFLAMPISFKGRLIQYAGRLHRPYPGKSEIFIYDYVDSSIGLGISMFRKRLSVYKKLGYSVVYQDNSKISKMTLRKKTKIT